MSPTLRLDPATARLEVARRARPPRAAVAYSWSLLLLAVALVGGSAAAGASWPAPGPLLLLAIPLALCTNRFVFFPNETGVTADAAVIVASMVAFRVDAPWLGPLVVALLVGVLDATHWRDRAFVRMAFNSGSTTLVAAAALVVFDAAAGSLGNSWAGLLGAALLAALPYLAAESVFGVLLMTMLGERPIAALRHQLPLHVLAFPLAAVGAVAGVAALELGWWAACVVLLPVPLVPELLIVVVPRRCSVGARGAIGVGVLATAVVLLGVATQMPAGPGATFVALTAVALLVGVEGRPGARVPVPLLAVVGIAAAVVVPSHPHDGEVVAAVALVIATSTASSWGWRSVRRARWGDLGWCVPVGAAAVFAAHLWQEVGPFGPFVFTAGIGVALVTVAAWGAPPWGSRCFGAWSHRHLERFRHGVLVVGASSALVCAVVGAPTVAGLCTQVALAMAATAVRQWRFAPRRRLRDGVAVGLLSVVSTVAMLLGAGRLAPIVTVTVTIVIAVTIAWPLALGSSSGRTRSRG